MKKIILALVCAVVLCNNVYSQAELKVKQEGITINNNGAENPEITSVLDVGSESKGVIFPRLSLQKRNEITSPPEGLMLYNTTLHTYEFFNGTEWLAMSGGVNYEIPPVPGNFIASAISYNQIDLSWSIDTTEPVQFVIERRTSSSSYETVASVQPGNISYSDVNGLLGYTEYFYRIKSSYGADSEYATEVSVITPIQSKTYNLGLSAGRISAFEVFTHGGVFNESGNAMAIYPLATNQVRFAEKSYLYADNWRKWEIYTASNTSNTKAMFYDLNSNTLLAELELSYTSHFAEFTLPAAVTGDFILRIQKTSDGGAQLFQIQRFVEKGL